MQSVGLRINEATESFEPINAPTIPTTTQDSGLIEVGNRTEMYFLDEGFSLPN